MNTPLQCPYIRSSLRRPPLLHIPQQQQLRQHRRVQGRTRSQTALITQTTTTTAGNCLVRGSAGAAGENNQPAASSTVPEVILTTTTTPASRTTRQQLEKEKTAPLRLPIISAVPACRHRHCRRSPIPHTTTYPSTITAASDQVVSIQPRYSGGERRTTTATTTTTTTCRNKKNPSDPTIPHNSSREQHHQINRHHSHSRGSRCGSRGEPCSTPP